MRQKRAKAYRKLMSLYSMSFGFRQPYQVLVDSEMCQASISQKVDLAKQLGVVLQGTVKPMITQCCIHELYLQGKTQQPAVDLAKTFERRKCNHREPILGDDCLASVVGETNKHRYVIATQSTELRSNLRIIPAVPVVHINRSVMILEPPSEATLRAKGKVEETALLPSEPERATISAAQPPPPPDPPRRKKGPKGPNPLSVKKKKTAPAAPPVKKPDASKVEAGKKRKADDSDEEAEEQKTKPSEGAGRNPKRKRHRKTATQITEQSEDDT